MSEPQTAGIRGVIIAPLKQIMDERGAVLHMLRADSALFRGFGEVYFSEVNAGVVKAWKRHKLMTQHFAVPYGRIKLVLFDDRTDSDTCGTVEGLELGRPDRYSLVCVPSGLWYGFQGISHGSSLLANCADLPHDPTESEHLPCDSPSIPYKWS